MYPKLAGMTGTAMTESGEFDSTYHLTVVEIPTNKPLLREDAADKVYKNEVAKLRAVIKEIEESKKSSTSTSDNGKPQRILEKTKISDGR